jgi:hypothetical protein
MDQIYQNFIFILGQLRFFIFLNQKFAEFKLNLFDKFEQQPSVTLQKPLLLVQEHSKNTLFTDQNARARQRFQRR